MSLCFLRDINCKRKFSAVSLKIYDLSKAYTVQQIELFCYMQLKNLFLTFGIVEIVY